MSTTVRYYSFGGLTLRSCIPLLVTPALNEHYDARISWGKTPDRLPAPLGKGPLWEFEDSRFLLRIDGVAKYLVSDGMEIIIDPAPRAMERAIRVHLMSTAIAALFHQRGLLPLHVSAIAFDHCGIAFCGPSGAGKSTLAVYLCKKYGHILMADDVCVVGKENSKYKVHPCAPYIRVWSDTVKALELGPESFQKDVVKNKFHLQMDCQFGNRPLPLQRVYVLKENSVAKDVSITPITGMRAAHVLINNTFRARQMRGMGFTASHMKACAALAEQVQIYELKRPFGFEFVDPTIVRLEEHLNGKQESG